MGLSNGYSIKSSDVPLLGGDFKGWGKAGGERQKAAAVHISFWASKCFMKGFQALVLTGNYFYRHLSSFFFVCFVFFFNLSRFYFYTVQSTWYWWFFFNWFTEYIFFFHVIFYLDVCLGEVRGNHIFVKLLLVANCCCYIFLLQWRLLVICHLLNVFFQIHKFFPLFWQIKNPLCL